MVLAGCGPKLRGVNVKVAVWPLSAGLGNRLLPMARSAPTITVTLAVTVLAGLGSEVAAEAVTVLVSVPETAPVTCPTMEMSGAVAPFALRSQFPPVCRTDWGIFRKSSFHLKIHLSWARRKGRICPLPRQS